MVMRETMKDGTTRLISGLTMDEIMLALHPVNEIYFSVDNVNPGTKFGGTWIAWGSGRVPVGVDAGQVKFDTVEETGGSMDYAIPGHSHAGPSHTHSIAGESYPTGITVSYTGSGTTKNAVSQGAYDGHSHGGATGSAGTGSTTTNSAGTVPLLQPYITCYMWKRTA